MKRIVTIFIIAGLVITSCNEKKEIVKVEESQKEFTPPFPHLNPSFTSYSLNAEEGKVIKRENGTSIYIPKNAFVDENGNLITGSVDISFREFDDAIDVFLSGIRMDMDVNGNKKHFETAGMFEINGSQNNNPIYVSKGKKIRVDIPASNTDEDFEIFKVNNNLEWEYASEKGEIILMDKEKALSEIREKFKTTPFPLTENYFVLNYWSVADVLFSSGGNRDKNNLVQEKMDTYGFTKYDFFNRTPIYFGGRDYPADLVLWELIGSKIPQDFQTDVYTKFTKMTGNKYKITLSKHDNRDKEFTTYANAIIPLMHLFKLPADEWKTKYDDYVVALKEEEKRVMMEQSAIRSLEVEDFGIYNWDRFVKYDNHVKILAKYNFENEMDNVFGTTVYCVLKNDNALVKLQYQDKLILTPEEPAKLFAILPGNKLWIHPISKFNELDFDKMKLETTPKHTFEFDEIKELKSEDEFRSLIKA